MLSALHVTVLGTTSLGTTWLNTLSPSEGAAADLAGTKLRTLATVLALSAGRAVSTDRLVDHLWEDEPPASAVKNLQLYVHRLRRQLDAVLPGAAGLLARVGPGYRLDVAPEAVDALWVSSLAHRGTDAAAEGRWPQAIELLSAALSSWPGEGLVGLVSSVPTEAAAGQLRERRLAAVEQLAAAELAIGAPERAVDLLLPQAAEHPMRESLHLLLMQALARLGQRAWAIEVYHGLRTVLSEELGIDPGAEIRRLFTAVLDGRVTVSALPAAS